MLEVADRMVALRPNESAGHYYRGVAPKEMQRLPEALEAYRAALARVPKPKTPQEAVGWEPPMKLVGASGG